MISMYRGELHKVSGITRQWPFPKPSITLSAFRQALEKRNDAIRVCCGSRPGFSTPCLTRQDTCVSGSHNVSPAHLRAMEGAREELETDIGREGRGESDGHVKADYMDEDVREDAEDAEDRSKQGGEARQAVGEEGYRDGSAPMEDSSEKVLVRGQSLDGHEPKHEPKLESAEPADLEDQMDRKERKKRKLEEASLMEARKGKVKVKVKEELVVAAAASGGVERMTVDAAGTSDEMELDQKVPEGLDDHKGASSEVEKTEKGGSDAVPELPTSAEEGDVKMEVNEDEQGDLVKVEAPPTPPVHSEEQNFGKPVSDSKVEGKDHVEQAKATGDPTGDKRIKKAELEAKLKKLTAEKHRLVQMLKQVLTTEKESKKKVQSASQSPSALGPPSAPGPASASQAIPTSTDVPAAPVAQSEITSAGGTEVIHKVDVPSATSHQVRPNRFGRHLTSSRHVQVLSTEEESKKKVQSASQSPPAPGAQPASQAAPISADVPAAPVVQAEGASAAASEVQPSADLEEGELEYARTPSPPSHTTSTSHAPSHGTHSSHGSAPALGPLLGRQPQHMNQGGSARGNYYQQGLSLPSPSSAAAAAALAGAISPGTGFMPLALGGRPNYQHQMVMQHAAALHAQKVAAVAAAAAAGHSHMSPILGGGGPAGAGAGVNNGPPGFGGYGVSPSVHGHHGHMSQGASPGAGHIAAQQGVASPSLLTTPRG
nr:hypothetical protein M758_2G073900 [Ceratodon purpureus]